MITLRPARERGHADHGHALAAGDALMYQDEDRLGISGGDNAGILVFDLPRLP